MVRLINHSIAIIWEVYDVLLAKVFLNLSEPQGKVLLWTDNNNNSNNNNKLYLYAAMGFVNSKTVTDRE
jgi:hypothetical protein